MDIDVLIEEARWEALGFEALAAKACGAVLAHMGYPEAMLAVLACDDARIADLNTEFRGKATPTNVLSWPSEERGSGAPGGDPIPPTDMELGDIAISYDTCAREAAEAGKDLSDHLCHLLVHGTLHLLGYDHIEDEDAALMEGLEVEILGNLGIDNPY